LAVLDDPLRRRGDRSEQSQGRERRRNGEVGESEQSRERLNVVDHRKDLFSTDDRYRDHRRTGAERDLDEPAATEALELVPLAERLADAFVAFGEHADDLAGVEQPGRVFRACKRVAALARDLTDEREP